MSNKRNIVYKPPVNYKVALALPRLAAFKVLLGFEITAEFEARYAFNNGNPKVQIGIYAETIRDFLGRCRKSLGSLFSVRPRRIANPE